ncbi:MAG: helix-turn-helix domain-containing protein, partial [Candidatus Aenigmarchaeota archaeon]|nr:helix-turn-helix domain-containing protein [Candidatus Aenigmarchaeota archaeon]
KMQEIARHFGVHYTTVSRWVRAGEEAVEESGKRA